jgi:hypothetical protein|tara:strand:- start:1682 stop:2026 length:345 start_codon:yes stop_codon:yes gene_type:complete
MNPVEKFNKFMTQHTDKVPLLSVESTDDKRFTVLREFLSSSFEDVEDNAWSVSQNLGKFIDALSTMEPQDIKKITNTVRKYEVKGENFGIHGEGRYGYDRSRVDRALIRRKRAN